MSLSLPDPYVGGDALDDLPSDPVKLAAELQGRLDSIQRNFERFAQQYPAGIGAQYQSQVPQARVWRSTNQSITNATRTAVSFDTVAYDLGAPSDQWAGGTPTRLTCVVPGLYHISGAHQWAANATGGRQAELRLNGTTFLDADIDINAGATQETNHTDTDFRLAAGDYVELTVFQNSGGALNTLTGTPYQPLLTWHWVSP